MFDQNQTMSDDLDLAQRVIADEYGLSDAILAPRGKPSFDTFFSVDVRGGIVGGDGGAVPDGRSEMPDGRSKMLIGRTVIPERRSAVPDGRSAVPDGRVGAGTRTECASRSANGQKVRASAGEPDPRHVAGVEDVEGIWLKTLGQDGWNMGRVVPARS